MDGFYTSAKRRLDLAVPVRDPARADRGRAQAAVVAPGGPLGTVMLTNGLRITVGDCPPICTASVGGYAGVEESGMIFDTHFPVMFPNGLTVGIMGMPGGNAAPNGLQWDTSATGRAALKTFPGGSGGSSGPLARDAVNPLSTFGGGKLAIEAATLSLNLAFVGCAETFWASKFLFSPLD